jgi:D-glycero-D-manno-heptose 1,7-bisphosphate phosphatase
MSTHITKLVILGRDGILNRYREDHVKSPDQWLAIEGAIEAVARLNHGGWHTVVATNQSGIGRGAIDMASLNAIHVEMNRQMMREGARLDAVFFCPHTPEQGCDCRKPLPGMMLDIAHRYAVDLHQVPMVGDTLRDLIAAHAAGCQPHLVKSGRAANFGDEEIARIRSHVPEAQVHDTLGAFAEALLAEDAVPHAHGHAA